MEWSPAAASVWGKLDPDSASWLPLIKHLEHAAAMAGLLWDDFVPSNVKTLIATDLDAPADAARDLCCFYAGVHDTGKASVAFARMADHRGMQFVLDRMGDEGLTIVSFPPTDNVRHETVSQLAVRDWLVESFGATSRVANTWACVVGGHHGRNPTDVTLSEAENRPHIVGTGRWAQVRKEVLDTMAQHTGVDEHFSRWASRRLPVRAQVLLTAIVVVADWLASNQDYVPYHDQLSPVDRAAVAYDTASLPAPWRPLLPRPDGDSLLRARFPELGSASARPIQKSLLSAALECVDAPLLIVEAPMGGGKTEAALLAAEALSARFGQGGVYFGLPTMATANPMFDRILGWLGTTLGRQQASVSLAHGKAGLNDTYTGLLPRAWQGQVYDEDSERGRPVVNDWLRGRHRAGLADFVVGTIDQGLFVALKAKYVALRHLGLAGKVVIIDEVHAADVYMREYLKRTLSWLGAYQAPVVLMSATLPPAQRDEYIGAYAAGHGDLTPYRTSQSDMYPRLTCYSGGLHEPSVSSDAPRLDVQLVRMLDGLVPLLDLIRSHLAGGGVAGVICNTVSRAQQAYRVLHAEFGADVVLLHSRFIAPDRARRERALIDQLGRGGCRPERLVVVGTQVLEQSIDVDFDVLVTDLAPADLLLQRIGRLHRHDRPGRPSSVSRPVVHLRGVDDWGVVPPVPARGSLAVYGEAALLRAAATLASRDDLALPDDIAAAVRQAYDPDLVAPSGWEDRWAVAEKQAADQWERARMRAQAYLLAEPMQRANLTGWIDVQAGDPDRSEAQGRSQVRDSEDALEVIALWRDADGYLKLPDCAPAHPGALIPEGLQWGVGSEQSLAREMASCTLSLPVHLANKGMIDRVISELETSVDYSGWQTSQWIKGQLVLVFDSDNRACLAGLELHYTPDEGLVVAPPEEKR